MKLSMQSSFFLWAVCVVAPTVLVHSSDDAMSSDEPTIYFGGSSSSDVPSEEYASDPPSASTPDAPSFDSFSDVPSDYEASFAPTSGPTISGIQCTDISYDNTTVPVCYKVTAEAISSIGMFENGTDTPASQQFNWQFELYDTDRTFTGYIVKVQRSGEVQGTEDRTECDFVEINGETCSSCDYCGNDRFTADCTNLVHGRSLECESISPLFFPLTADAVSILQPGDVECSMIDDGIDIFEVCYEVSFSAISSIGQYPNGTSTPAGQRYFYDYKLNVSEFESFNISMARSGEVEGTDDRTECDFVEVDGEMCSSCSYCGDETFTADCTNILHGRFVECESAFPVFFPLTSDKLLLPEPPVGAGINCTDIDDGMTVFEVCFTAAATGSSSISMYPNGTEMPAQQSYAYTYTIVDDDANPTGLEISMGRSGENDGKNDRTVCDFVEVSGESCKSCKFCGDDLFSADCTNLEYGRKVKCEPAFPLFYPFTSEKSKE